MHIPALVDGRLKLRHLQAFAAVAREHTVQRASDALALTPSAVSKALQELEGLVGQALFRRTRKGLLPTDAGERLMRHVQPGLALLRDGMALAAGRPGDAGLFQVRLGVLPTVASAVAPLAVQRLLLQQPHCRMQVIAGTNAQLLDQLRDGELDLVVGRLPDPALMFGLSFEPLYTEPMVLVVAPDHPLADPGRVPQAADLLGYPLLLPLGNTIVRHAVDTFFLAAGLGPPRQVVEALSESFARALVSSSQTIWFSPLGSVAPDVRAGLLRRLPLDTGGTAGPIGLSLRAGASLQPAAAAMADALRQQARLWRESN